MLRKSLPLIISTAIFSVLSYATTILLAHVLGQSNYGVIMVVTSIITNLNIMQTTGIPQAMAKFIAEDTNKADSILRKGRTLQLSLAAILVAVLWAASPWLQIGFHDRHFAMYLIVMALSLPPYGQFSVYLGFFQGKREFSRQAMLSVIYGVSKAVFVIGFAVAFGIFGAFVGYVVSPAVPWLVGHIGHSRFGLKDANAQAGSERAPSFETKKLLLYSLPIVIFSVLLSIQYNIDLYTIKATASLTGLAGDYGAAQNIAIIPFQGLAALGQVLLPSVSRELALGKFDKAGEAISSSLRYLLLLLLPATAVLSGGADRIVALLYGSQFSGAAAALQVLVVSYVFITVFSFVASALNGAGKPKLSSWFAAMALLITFVLCLVLVRVWGMRGTALGVGVGAACAAICGLWATHSLTRFRFPWLSLARAFVGSVLVFAVASFGHGYMSMLLTWPLALVLYVAFLFISGEITREERGYIRQLGHTESSRTSR